jgi:chromate transporter
MVTTKEIQMNLLWLILQFLWIGSLTFGGGMVAITLLFDAFVISGNVTETFYLQMVTIAESTPGPIAINLATYLGVAQFGVFGGLITTLSFILPSMMIIWTMYPIYRRYATSAYVKSLLVGLRVIVFGIIMIAMVRMGLSLVEEIIIAPVASISLLMLTIFLLPKMKNRPFILLMMGAVFGILFF